MDSSILTSGFSRVDSYGFKRSGDFDHRAYDDFMKEYYSVLERRQARWKKVVYGSIGGSKDGKEIALSKGRRLKRFVRKGIPMDKRPEVWMAVSGATWMRSKDPEKYLKALEKKPDPDGILVEQISVDIPRTFPSNVKFSKSDPELGGGELQQSLFNVLLAFSNSNNSIGYCQGLNYVAGILLIITKNEDSAFWLLKTLIEDILPNYYAPSIPGLLTDVRVIGELLEERCPRVHKHAKTLEMPWELVLTKWLMCLFVDVLPIETALRVLDCLFYEGSKILIRVALAIVLICEEDIIKAKNLSELVACFKECTKSEKVLKCHDFMSKVFVLTNPLPRERIEKMRQLHGRDVEEEEKKRQERLKALKEDRNN